MSAAAIQFFLTMRNQIKLYHWQTHSYARHKATDEVVESLDKNIDRFVEVYIGKYGRPKFSKKSNKVIELEELTDKKAMAFVKVCIEVLSTVIVVQLKPETDSDLFNIRDEMLSDLNQLLYLFSLH